jgi:dTDP-glucose pyrophosphorylase
MINILLPLGGNDFFSADSFYPKWLVEIKGKPMIQVAIENYKSIASCKPNFIFPVKKESNTKFHLNNILEIVTEGKCNIISLEQDTGGAACSCLMGVDYINNETPLIIANYDQVFLDGIIDKGIAYFEQNNADAGVICFETVHPRWSYVRTNADDVVVETAEKRPLSKLGIAGFYYFKAGADFVGAAQRSILKDSRIDGKFFIAPVLNELVLQNKKILKYQVDNAQYKSFYTLENVKEFNEAEKPWE